MVSCGCCVYDVDNPVPDGDVDLRDWAVIQRVWRVTYSGFLEGRLWRPPDYPEVGEAVLVGIDGSRLVMPLDDNGAFCCDVLDGWQGFYRKD